MDSKKPVKNFFGKIMYYIILVVLVVLIASFVVSGVLIGDAVDRECSIAQQKYDSDCTGALIMTLEDPESDYLRKNEAVWALGQLGEARALDTVSKYYQGETKKKACDRSQELCQCELQKAVKLLQGGANLTAIIWR